MQQSNFMFVYYSKWVQTKPCNLFPPNSSAVPIKNFVPSSSFQCQKAIFDRGKNCTATNHSCSSHSHKEFYFCKKKTCTVNCNEIFWTMSHYLLSYIESLSAEAQCYKSLSLFDLFSFCKQYWSWPFIMLSPAETNAEIQDSASCRLN